MTGVRTKAHSRREEVAGVGDQGNLNYAESIAANRLAVAGFGRGDAVLEPGHGQAGERACGEDFRKNSGTSQFRGEPLLTIANGGPEQVARLSPARCLHRS